MKVGKPKSKRVPVRLRHKIEKASNAKKRQQRRQAKKDPTWRTKLKKDPGIPNLFPYKDKILKQIEETKQRREEEERQKRKGAREITEDKQDQHMKDDVDQYGSDVLLDNEYSDEESDGDADMVGGEDSVNPMAALLASAAQRATDYDQTHDSSDSEEEFEADSATPFNTSSMTPTTTSKDKTPASHSTALKQLIANSDVLLHILDARDPLSTRSSMIEKAVSSHPNKRLLLILNKIDLIPPHVLKSWVSYLRRSFPVLPLRSSSSAPSAKTYNHKEMTPQKTADNVIKALKSYASHSGLNQASMTVGIVGYPNVGKSSVVNALTSRLSGVGTKNTKKAKIVPVGAEAGVTTALREIKLDSKIRLIDSPGVVSPPSSKDATGLTSDLSQNPRKQNDPDTHARLVLLNAIPPREIEDPIPAISLLLHRLSETPTLLQKLLDAYTIPPLMTSPTTHQNPSAHKLSHSTKQSYGYDKTGTEKVPDMTTDFLIQVARKRGRLGKGGVPNLNAAAMTVLGDWRDGRVEGWVLPPALEKEDEDGEEKSEERKIVSQWAEEFKIEGLWNDFDEEGDYDGGEGEGVVYKDVEMRS